MKADRERNLSPIALSLVEDLREGRVVGRSAVGELALEAIAGAITCGCVCAARRTRSPCAPAATWPDAGA
jgi:hypothetical protein